MIRSSTFLARCLDGLCERAQRVPEVLATTRHFKTAYTMLFAAVANLQLKHALSHVVASNVPCMAFGLSTPTLPLFAPVIVPCPSWSRGSRRVQCLAECGFSQNLLLTTSFLRLCNVSMGDDVLRSSRPGNLTTQDMVHSYSPCISPLFFIPDFVRSAHISMLASAWTPPLLRSYRKL